MECVERGLDPLDTCLVVADSSRTEKTICLAVSPALKAYGTGGRPRLFEVVEKVNLANAKRGHRGKSYSAKVLDRHPELAIDYIIAPPRMAYYIEYSTRIYEIYLRYIAPEDIHVYSIDEVFIDVTPYLKTYRLTPHQLAMKLIREVLAETGVTATAGVGTNMYLAKIAMDIVAKKMPPDADGVRIAELDEMSYRQKLWEHEPLTDFWRIGRGIVKRLVTYGIRTMGDIARLSVNHEDWFFKEFGVNAEFLIDHAWGWEPAKIEHIKAYRPETHSISSGQVLTEPYKVETARIVVLEMIDAVSLELVDKRLVTNQLTLTVSYDSESLTRPEIRRTYHGPVSIDFYGRQVPVHSHGTANIPVPTSSSRILSENISALYDRIVNPKLLVRRLTVCANRLMPESMRHKGYDGVQLNLFEDYDDQAARTERESLDLEKERRNQEAVLNIKKKFGKNAILRGLNFAEGATQKNRNRQIGGHHE